MKWLKYLGSWMSDLDCHFMPHDYKTQAQAGEVVSAKMSASYLPTTTSQGPIGWRTLSIYWVWCSTWRPSC